MTLQNAFEKIFSMSVTASVVIAVVLVFRLLLRRYPKWITYALWSVVLIRLLCPVSITSSASVIPQRVETVTDELTQQLMPSLEISDMSVVSVPENVFPTDIVPPEAQENTVVIPMDREAVVQVNKSVSVDTVWLLGALAMGLWGVFSYLRLRRSLVGSLPVEGNVVLADRISTPFVLGLFKPQIYLPSDLPREEWDYILAHEQCHIRRGDHIFKLLSYAALCLHWFNPLAWLAFYLAEKDMEMSCDEAVVRKLGPDIRADYAQSLLKLATGKLPLSFVPLAFGEGDTKGRIRNLSNWNKPVIWALVIAVVLCVILAVCLVTDPVRPEQASVDKGTYCWVDYSDGGMPWDETRSIQVEQFPDVTFLWSSQSLVAEEDGNETVLYVGMPIWNVFFTDLNGDGYPELCSACSFGYGLVDTRVIVYDYVNKSEFSLSNRGYYDYYLELQDNTLWVQEREYRTSNLIQTEILAMIPSDDGSGWQLNVQCSKEPSPEMVPTTSTMLGPYDSCLFVRLDGQTYRYRREGIDPNGLTVDALLDTYYETSLTGVSYAWTVYSTKEYPDHSVLLVCMEDQLWMSYRYSPPQRVRESLWETVKKLGDSVIQENGDVTSGQDLWLDFAKKTDKGEKDRISIADYYTLDPARCSDEFYQTYAEDYPCLYLHELSYDGSVFTISWVEDGATITRTYKYLMHYFGEPESEHAAYDAYDKYVLTNDNTVSWEDIFAGMVSSQAGAYIDHYTVYNDYIYRDE